MHYDKTGHAVSFKWNLLSGHMTGHFVKVTQLGERACH